MLTLAKTEMGWTITATVNGVVWWEVSYPDEAQARETLARMEEEER